MYRLVVGEPGRISKDLASLVGELAQKAVEKKGYFNAGLAGGRTPKGVYETMRESYTLWRESTFYPTDERYVPSSDPLSNYRFLRESLGEKAKVYRVRTELPLKEACREFGRALPLPSLDFILLGLGSDGHTASLFPGTPCELCTESTCTSRSPDGLERISMSLRYINSARRIAFLVLGEDKRSALEALLEGRDIPAARVSNGEEILIFTDLLL